MLIQFKVAKYQKHDTLYINKVNKGTLVSSNTIQLDKLELPNYTFDKQYSYNNTESEVVHVELLNDLFKYINSKLGRSKAGQEKLDTIYANMVETTTNHVFKGMIPLSSLELIVRHKYLVETLAEYIKGFLIVSKVKGFIKEKDMNLIFFDVLFTLTARISLSLVDSGVYDTIPDLTKFKTISKFDNSNISYPGIWWQR